MRQAERNYDGRVIEAILPAGVVAVDMFDDPPGATLMPEEEALIAKAVPKRRKEFTTVRHCARIALDRLGRPPAAIVSGQHREPRWPAGVVGAITHCDGYRAVVLAESSVVTSIGIDAEPNGPLPKGVLASVAGAAECAHIAGLLATRPEVSWDRLLFCAKEAVYKAWYPLAERWLGFGDAVVTMQPGPDGHSGTFDARLLVDGPEVDGRKLDGFTGRWLVGQGLILTAIVRTPAGG